jgi:hypothetical protein
LAFALAAVPVAGQTAVQLAPVATGLAYPVAITNAGDGSGRLFITLQGGQIRVHDGTQLLATPFLDISGLVLFGGERGLLSVAFDPAYSANRRFYVFYNDTGGNLLVARYLASSSNANVADPAPGQILLTIPHPTHANHNGGQLQFGPDGYLYVGTGDGGGAGDPPGNAQNLSVLLGKILRIDVSAAGAYTVPATNPFVGTAGARAEIWDYGLRNPWRFSFDRTTGDLLIGDVGQNAWEEIDFEPAPSVGGVNYGWNRMEGTHCFNPATGCDTGGLQLPILEYSHAVGCSVTGGYRYRGSGVTNLGGVYVYGDYCSGTIWGATERSNGTWTSATLLQTPYPISAFGEDEAGELYVTDYAASGAVFRIAARLQVTSLTSDVAFPVAAGTPVTWTAVVTGSTDPLEYRFWRFDVATQAWTMVRDYSAANTLVWTPSSGDVGQHQFGVWVRHVGSTLNREAALGTATFAVQ